MNKNQWEMGFFTRKEKRKYGKVRLKHEELNSELNFGKERWKKGEENMSKWRRLEERQDHNEGQKDRTEEWSRENQNTAWRTPNNSGQLEKRKLVLYTFKSVRMTFFSRSIDVTYRSQEIFWMALPASCSSMTFDVVSLTTRKSWYRQESKQRSVFVNYM